MGLHPSRGPYPYHLRAVWLTGARPTKPQSQLPRQGSQQSNSGAAAQSRPPPAFTSVQGQVGYFFYFLPVRVVLVGDHGLQPSQPLSTSAAEIAPVSPVDAAAPVPTLGPPQAQPRGPPELSLLFFLFVGHYTSLVLYVVGQQSGTSVFPVQEG